jgi:hypothetical protein
MPDYSKEIKRLKALRDKLELERQQAEGRWVAQVKNQDKDGARNTDAQIKRLNREITLTVERLVSCELEHDGNK